MNSSMCTGIDRTSKLRTERLKDDKRWFYVPPYRKAESDTVVDSSGQHIATFENKEDAIKCVESYNKSL